MIGKIRRTGLLAILVTGLLAGSIAVADAAPKTAPKTAPKAAPKTGAKCTSVGAVSGALACSRKAGRLVWAKADASPNGSGLTASGVAGATPSSVATATTANAGTNAGTTARTTAGTTGTGTTATAGIEGVWKATPDSAVGYRVKEVLEGQSTEGVGRTNAVTGTVLIAGTKVTSVELSVDMTTMKSDQRNRDKEFHGRIMDTAKYPTAKLKLTSPIDFGHVPVDREQVNVKAKGDLTLHGLTKPVELDISARIVGASVEVQGAYKIVFSEWGIPAPSVAGVVKTEDDGELEFLVVFAR